MVQNLFSRFTGAQGDILSRLAAEDRRLVNEVVERNLTYLSPERLYNLVSTCRTISEARVPGAFIEAGCALGGSTVLLAKLKPEGVPLRVYDVFATIPPPSDADGVDVHERYAAIVRGESKGINGDTYYGYEKDLLAIVKRKLSSFGIEPQRDHVELIQGLLQERLTVEEPVAFAHVDVDWYEPVMACLQRIVPRLAVGGALILDDYNDWSGCRKAADEYFAQTSPSLRMENRRGSMTITRVS
ncbi:MAG: class I SAM-dependent methyltransferase [Methylibium sp.]|nr:class I SAM-dependent methyltransferase [Methylibium sp.]